MKIPMGSVNSSVIQKIGFSGEKGESGTLKIEFADGAAATYRDVDYQTYRRFVLARSHGEFFNTHIRGKFSKE